MRLNKRDQAIIDWAKKQRPEPDITPHLENIFSMGTGSNRERDAALLLMCVAFEAGREFQHANPKLELNNPNVYSQT